MTDIIERIISGECKLCCLRCGRSLKVLSVTDDDIKVERCDCFKFGFTGICLCDCKKTEGVNNG